MRRRDFFCGAALLTLGLAGCSQTSTTARKPTTAIGDDRAFAAANRLLQAYPSRTSLAAIGDMHQQEARKSGLPCPDCLQDAVGDLLQHLDWSEERLLGAASTDIRAHIEMRTAADFADGRIVYVRGWMLGEAEVRLCNVAAMHSA